MAIAQEPTYRGIPPHRRQFVTELHKDIGNRFYARSSEGFDELVEMGILYRILGSDPNSPNEYRFTSEALRDLQELSRNSSSFSAFPGEVTEWEEMPYSLDLENVEGKLILLMPYMEEFVKSFYGRVFRYSEFSEFVAEEEIEDSFSSKPLETLFRKGIVKKRKNKNKREYQVTDAALKYLGD